MTIYYPVPVDDAEPYAEEPAPVYLTEAQAEAALAELNVGVDADGGAVAEARYTVASSDAIPPWATSVVFADGVEADLEAVWYVQYLGPVGRVEEIYGDTVDRLYPSREAAAGAAERAAEDYAQMSGEPLNYPLAVIQGRPDWALA